MARPVGRARRAAGRPARLDREGQPRPRAGASTATAAAGACSSSGTRSSGPAGLRFGRTLGSPLAFRDREPRLGELAGTHVRRAHPGSRPAEAPSPSPGPATPTWRARSSTTRPTCATSSSGPRRARPRRASLAGAVCRQLLASAGVAIWSFVEQLGPDPRVSATPTTRSTAYPTAGRRGDLAAPDARCAARTPTPRPR